MSHRPFPQQDTVSRQFIVPNAGKRPNLPPSNGKIRPDPRVLSSAERMTEFGRLMLRAIERRRSHQE